MLLLRGASWWQVKEQSLLAAMEEWSCFAQTRELDKAHVTGGKETGQNEHLLPSGYKHPYSTRFWGTTVSFPLLEASGHPRWRREQSRPLENSQDPYPYQAHSLLLIQLKLPIVLMQNHPL